MSETQTKEVKADRIVTLEDGVATNFGKRANLLTVVDEAAGTIVFKIITGKVIPWTVPFVEGLSDFQKTVYFYGLAAKVKSSLAPVDLADLQVAIEKQITSIDAGVFILRPVSEGASSLTNLQKAYALVKASRDEALAHWAEFTPAVIAEVAALWATFDVSQKNSIRKDAYVRLELAKLDASTAVVADLV